MSPRLTVSTRDCSFCEYDQYETESGLVMGTYICHHPDRDGCWCTSNGFASECYCPPKEEEKKKQPAKG